MLADYYLAFKVNPAAAAALGLDLHLNFIIEEKEGVPPVSAAAASGQQESSLRGIGAGSSGDGGSGSAAPSCPPPPPPLKLFKAHGYQVLVPPPGAVVVARSTRTPVEVTMCMYF
jgi:hypothetical protein